MASDFQAKMWREGLFLIDMLTSATSKKISPSLVFSRKSAPRSLLVTVTSVSMESLAFSTGTLLPILMSSQFGRLSSEISPMELPL